VEIMETRPISKYKNWRLLKVVTKGPDLSSMIAVPSRQAAGNKIMWHDAPRREMRRERRTTMR